jgi:hypothetical protein
MPRGVTENKKPAAESKRFSDAGCMIVLGSGVLRAGEQGILPAVVALFFVLDIHRSVEVDVQNVGDGYASKNQDEAKHFYYLSQCEICFRLMGRIVAKSDLQRCYVFDRVLYQIVTSIVIS